MQLFSKMLAAATGRDVTAGETSATGTSIGASLLASDRGAESNTNSTAPIFSPGPEWQAYATHWRRAVAR